MKSHYEINNQYSTTILSTSSFLCELSSALINIVLPMIKIRLRELDFSKDRTDRGEDGKGDSSVIIITILFVPTMIMIIDYHHYHCNFYLGQGWDRPKDWDLLGGFSR